jgi:hypothetical protein
MTLSGRPQEASLLTTLTPETCALHLLFCSSPTETGFNFPRGKKDHLFSSDLRTSLRGSQCRLCFRIFWSNQSSDAQIHVRPIDAEFLGRSLGLGFISGTQVIPPTPPHPTDT